MDAEQRVGAKSKCNPGVLSRECSGLPENIKKAFETGSFEDLSEDLRSAACSLGSKASGWIARLSGQDLDSEPNKELENQAQGGGSVASSSTTTASGRLGPQSSLLQQDSVKATEFSKYLFLDEGKDKGVVKVYIKAEANFVHKFVSARATFLEKRLSVQVTDGEGQIWSLEGNLYGAVLPMQCKYAVSSTGHKIVVTLRKAEPAITWHSLLVNPGASFSPVSHASFI